MSTIEQGTSRQGTPLESRRRAPRVSVLIPCLNEADTIEECVSRARKALATNEISGEIIVIDNGSDDGSGALALTAGARVVTRARARLRLGLSGRVCRRPRAVHRDGRRRPDLRLRGDPAVPGRARGRGPTSSSATG